MMSRVRGPLIVVAGVLFFGGFLVSFFVNVVVGVMMTMVATFLSITLAMTTESSRAKLRRTPARPADVAPPSPPAGRQDGLDHVAATGVLDASEIDALRTASRTRSPEETTDLIRRVQALHDMREAGHITITEYVEKKRRIFS